MVVEASQQWSRGIKIECDCNKVQCLCTIPLQQAYASDAPLHKINRCTTAIIPMLYACYWTKISRYCLLPWSLKLYQDNAGDSNNFLKYFQGGWKCASAKQCSWGIKISKYEPVSYIKKETSLHLMNHLLFCLRVAGTSRAHQYSRADGVWVPSGGVGYMGQPGKWADRDIHCHTHAKHGACENILHQERPSRAWTVLQQLQSLLQSWSLL